MALRRVSAGAERLLVGARTGERPLQRRGERIPLGDLGEEECVSYTVDLTRDPGDPRAMVRTEHELLVSPGFLFWQPVYAGRTNFRVRVNLDLPEGVSASAPWGEVLDHSIFAYAGNLALTRRVPQRFDVGTVEVLLARFEGALSVDEGGLRRWVATAVQAALRIGGRFPRRLHIAIVPAGPGERPVAFGLVRRGGGASVLLFPHAHADESALVADWVAVHELIHLTVPRLDGDRWLSEGYATYLQEILRAREGLFPPERAFERLAANFELNRRGAGMPLSEESDRMSETRTYRHVYWSGAAFFFLLDVELHRRGTSLVEVVGREPWAGEMAWAGRRWLTRIDELAGESIAVPLAARMAETQEIPDMQPTFQSLGAFFVDGRLEWRDAPEAELGRRMLAPMAGETL